MARSLRTLAIILAVAVALTHAIASSTAVAKSKGKGKGKSNAAAVAKQAFQNSLRDAQRRAAAAQQVLAAGMAKGQRAQSTMTALTPQYEAAVNTANHSKSMASAATDSFRSIENGVLQSVDEDSELGRATEALSEVGKKFQRATDRILNSDGYQAKHREALRSHNKTVLLPKIRKESLEGDAPWRDVLAELEYAKATHARLRSAYLKEDPAWVASAEESRDARAHQAKAKQALSNMSLKMAGTRASLRNATKMVVSARQALAKEQATIKKLQESIKRIGSSQNRSRNSRSRR